MVKNDMMRIWILVVLLNVLSFAVFGQGVAVKGSDVQVEYQAQYDKNIKLSKVNGVYIPRDLNDAFKRLSRLSPPESRNKFKDAEEDMVCKKLHFGLGKWMMVNWSFYAGSRFSHILKEKGILHPDDMAQFVLHTYHRFLNDLPLEEEAMVKKLANLRKNIAREAFEY